MISDETMERLLAYATKFKRDFSARIRGASAEQIMELEGFTGRLPAYYIKFLQKMGLDDGGLDLTFDGTTRITDIIDYYRSEVRTGERDLPANCILIGVGAVSIPDIGLIRVGDDEPPVVFTDGDEIAGLFSDSLEKLLFSSVFAKYRMALYPYEAFLSASSVQIGKQNASKTARALALKCGFMQTWFTDRVTFCADKNEAAICIMQFEGQGISIRISAGEKHLVASTVEEMRRELNLNPAEWSERKDISGD